MHDLTLAPHRADRRIALGEGRIIAQEPTREVLTPDLIQQVFGVAARVTPSPRSSASLAIQVAGP